MKLYKFIQHSTTLLSLIPTPNKYLATTRLTGVAHDSRTPVPAALQACPESRNILQGKRGYQKIERNPRCQIFNKAGTKALDEIFDATDEDVGEDEEFRGDLTSVPRHVWVNFDLDLIDIGEGRHLGTHSFVGRHNAAVKRLKFKRTDWCFVEDEYPFGKRYKNLEAVYVQCPPGNPSKWREGVVELGWVCNPANVHLIPYSTWTRRK
ncbi:hypothetical protein SMACR_00455 [Sordaria macrospora]|uniref:WGS project CABT00000000 data, contig 2.1 n=2 Tax=Sordaria macrospora TaxID=5147 RepID=F7VL61_SORMK|nr:uncharacterized protein SMAC_00455 [Sordaria macrospora k-hell]KAA8631925.1 hypothetical protein SMACR_00455 [Sordaria macrospora]WPJ59205.1 hypothetical protein SMAC4_00455 [Sordaria macrospora]CCC06238.1 unnamed protein product [Sordaria macrospora k-hell]